MTVSHEIKSQLAKLLATEDLIVEHRAVETAQFNVHTRVLTLPQWDKASSVVYDMLVGHEVGHALFTPDVDPPEGIPHSFINIVEDARIEKLMKMKYPGLSKTFFRAYKELSDEDFFCLENEDISKMNLADRVNLYFKIGNFVDIPFNDFDEMPIVRMIGECETFSDVLIAAEFLYKFCKKPKQEEKMDIPAPTQGQGGGETPDNSEKEDVDTDGISEEGGSSEVGTEDENVKSKKGGTSFEEEPEVQTVDNLEQKLKQLISESRDTVYVEIPELNLDTVIAANADVHEECDGRFGCYASEAYENPDFRFKEFKKSAQKEVNYLVKEFECRKSADSYARATVSRTGVLDTTKLHTYRYNEDLFKKVTVLPQGKNHGLIFVLDWSGSMASQLLETLKQMYNLLWFCKKCQIPFDVYAFTNEWKIRTFEREIFKDMTPVDEVKANQFSICEEFNMLNLFTSKVKTAELNEQMKAIYRIAHTFSNKFSGYYSYPYALSLSGTPLNEALVCLDAIIPQFKQKNKMQKVHCIVLTDGEAQVSRINTIVQAPWEAESRMGMRAISDRVILRNRKNGNTYTFDYGWQTHTKTFNRYLKDQFPEVNMIGIRVCSTRDFGSFLRVALGYSDEYNKVLSDWKKTRAVSFDGFGYSKQFAIASNALAQDSEFDVDEGATKTKIKSAFIKSLKTKKMNKKILSEFISMVA